ncbi:ABC transporter permease [Deinococcus marmoris]|uniref:Ribose ABC transport system, permease protein RbsC n=1 Tax=Deinococcus marmoris TaxID=249408 RepID=A0A1U7P1E9_9DEIO|nr:ABC transporter permease [Deinococcus marmoris]OLV18989.1 Ribose ABC transport system, permease protein RbsC [Deinococcus marmoris]
MLNTNLTRDPRRARLISLLGQYGVLAAFILLIIFGALRYTGFMSEYNFSTFLRYNAMFGLISLGMCFVIITGGIDLSVGSVVAMSSVVAALLSPYGVIVAVLGAVAAGALVGMINGLIITRLNIQPFIVTLATLLGARGMALLLARNQGGVGIDLNNTALTWLGQGDLLRLPVPGVILLIAFIVGGIALRYSPFGRHALAVGGGEDASKLMGLNVNRVLMGVYVLSGALAGLAGMILAAQLGAGQPTEGLGWELSAIAAVVVGGTLLTGGTGSVWSTLVGALLLGLIFNILNFENGKGIISLSPYWQSVIRGGFLLVVVVIQSRTGRSGKA